MSVRRFLSAASWGFSYPHELAFGIVPVAACVGADAAGRGASDGSDGRAGGAPAAVALLGGGGGPFACLPLGTAGGLGVTGAPPPAVLGTSTIGAFGVAASLHAADQAPLFPCWDRQCRLLQYRECMK